MTVNEKEVLLELYEQYKDVERVKDSIEKVSFTINKIKNRAEIDEEDIIIINNFLEKLIEHNTLTYFEFEAISNMLNRKENKNEIVFDELVVDSKINRNFIVIKGGKV